MYFRVKVWFTGIGLISCLFSQPSFSGSLTGSYGQSRNNYNFQEGYLDLNIFGPAWAVWTQLEYSNPPELGRPLKGVRKFRFEYRGPGIEWQVGDLYHFWGRGLILNQFDNRFIDLDNSFRGAALKGNWGRASLELLGANRAYWFSSNQWPDFSNRVPNYKTRHSLLGGHLSMHGNQFIAGVSFLSDEEQHPIPFNRDYLPDTLTIDHQITGPFFEWTGSNFDFSFEAVNKHTRIETSSRSGLGIYSDLNYYWGRWSVSLAYKNYRFLDLNPDERGDGVNHGAGAIPFQQFPTVFREHSTRLLNRISHQMDPNDEVGYNVHISGPVYRQHVLTAELSRASRHYSWHLTDDGIWVKTGHPAKEPLSSIRTNPFSECILEVEGETTGGRFQYSLSYAKTADNTHLVSATAPGANSSFSVEILRAVSIPFQASLALKQGWSVDVKWEYQRLVKGTWSQKREQGIVIRDTVFSAFANPVQINRFISVGLGNAPRWSLAVLLDLSSTEEYLVVEEKKGEHPSVLDQFFDPFIGSNLAWISLEGIVNLSERTRITIMVGSQRGGLLCSNGVCRYIQSFRNGIKLGFISLF